MLDGSCEEQGFNGTNSFAGAQVAGVGQGELTVRLGADDNDTMTWPHGKEPFQAVTTNNSNFKL